MLLQNKWDKLKVLNLSKYLNIQVLTTLVMMAFLCW